MCYIDLDGKKPTAILLQQMDFSYIIEGLKHDLSERKTAKRVSVKTYAEI